MTERTRPAPDPVRATARQASNIVERLDIMWEQARNDAPHPYVSVSVDTWPRSVNGATNFSSRPSTACPATSAPH
ncbi:hypothetical protein [Streptomyces mirabilis]|uniref:hypothetical protein n=1 Tax=Streptomyces mirabilis TaxID=68239 RepID=UPI0036C507A3